LECGDELASIPLNHPAKLVYSFIWVVYGDVYEETKERGLANLACRYLGDLEDAKQ